MTVTTRVESVPCPLTAGVQAYSITVRDAPAGTRAAQVVWRSVNRGSVTDSVYVTGTITLE